MNLADEWADKFHEMPAKELLYSLLTFKIQTMN